VTPSDIVTIPFHGTEVLAVEIGGKPHVVLRPAIENLGLDYSTQLVKLRGRSWAVVGQSPTTGSDGKTYQMTTVDLRTFLMLLATINENNVSEDLRGLLIAYQSDVADVVEAHFTKAAVPAFKVPQTYQEALREIAREIDAHEATKELVKEMEPKAEYVDKFVSADDLVLIRDLAIELKVREHDLRELLVEKRWIYRKDIGRHWSAREHKLVDVYEWRCYADRTEQFQLRAQHNAPRHHNNQLRQTLYVTPEGCRAIAALVDKRELANA
jgi:hypothetical protein